MTKFSEAIEFARAQVAHYEALVAVPKDDGISADIWNSWNARLEEARRLLAELLKIQESERPEQPDMRSAKRAMAMAIDQLNDLRRHNEILRAKVDTMELLAGFLHAQRPCLTQGMREDAAWLLQRELEAMEKAGG